MKCQAHATLSIHWYGDLSKLKESLIATIPNIDLFFYRGITNKKCVKNSMVAIMTKHRVSMGSDWWVCK